MAGETIPMSTLKQIIRLRQAGVSLQRIARLTSTSRNTVKKYLRLIEVKGLRFSELLDKEDHEVDGLLADPDEVSDQRYAELETLFPYIEKELLRTGVNRWILWGEYKNKYPDGYSYARFCYHLNRWQETQHATMHFEHEPGDKLFIDFAGKKLSWVDQDTAEMHEAEVYISILGYSQLLFVTAVPIQQKEHFLSATEKAFYYYGGVTKALVPDNLKSAVHRADKYEPVLNSDFADFANHYGTVALPARSRRPRDKALVENAVQIVYSRIYAPLRNQVFFSLEELNRAISEQLELCNNMPFQGQPLSRRQKYEGQEKHLLHLLPSGRYEMKKYKWLTVMKNSHVQLSEDKHYYSVPYRFIGKKIKVVYSPSRVSVFYNKEQIAFHKREYKRFGYTTIKSHLPSTHQFISDWNADTFLHRAERIDPAVRKYMAKILEEKSYPEQAYRSCAGILAWERKAGRERLVKAVIRADHFGAYSYSIIDRILKGGLDRIEEEDHRVVQPELPFHENVRGADHYR